MTTFTKRFTSAPRGEPDREWAALTLLAAAVPDLVPAPLSRGALWVTMSVIPGGPLADPATPEQVEALGDVLDSLWSVKPAALLPMDIPALIGRTLKALVPLRERDDVIGRAAESAADLDWSSLLTVQDPVVAHGDPNLANYLWDGTTMRIVDFEDAGLGDRAMELANLLEHLAGRRTDWSPLLDRWPADPVRLQTARTLWAAFWLGLIGPGGPSANVNPPGTAEAQAERLLRLIAQL
ncbi:aminoglycoside phosphotransferase family protein [Kribbella antibiotica]|uniref:aminoglycoside phosphotransferase family protein n=1 Tax=Kribbella antibiotica TaxID=190195 RepID=UPI001404C815|nr:aminoglycoside phosphotransferase family protein [Kribbella antibiotica]